MKFCMAFLLPPTFFGGGLAQCAADNCLRAMRNQAVITTARSFCASYTASLWSSALPTYAANCNAAAVSISSACSCIGTSSFISASSTTPRTTQAPTPTPSGTSSVSSTSQGTCPSPNSPTPIISTVTVAETAGTSTVTVVVTASGSGCPISTTTTTITTTIEGSGTPIAGPPGSTNVPNGLFEDVSPGWCQPGTESQCSIVTTSSDGTFSGIYGSKMLAVAQSSFERLDIVRMDVPAVAYPNLNGRNWQLTALFRVDSVEGGCGPILGYWDDENGRGANRQLPPIPVGRWYAERIVIENSASGLDSPPFIFVSGNCDGSALIYVDGPSLT